MEQVLKNINTFSGDIKLSHSIFALPFALSVALLPNILVRTSALILVVLAIFFARTYSMGVNRILDRVIDRKNLRTASRPLAADPTLFNFYVLATFLAAIFFVMISWSLNLQCGLLSIPTLFILGWYSKMKKISASTHFFLGVCLALAPLGVSMAFNGEIVQQAVYIGGIVLFWVAGFDLIYSLQDISFDQSEGLRSIPAVFGQKGAVRVSQFSFLCCILVMISFGVSQGYGMVYYFSPVLCVFIFAGQHYFLRGKKSESGSIEKIFFGFNMWVGLIFFAAVLGERLL